MENLGDFPPMRGCSEWKVRSGADSSRNIGGTPCCRRSRGFLCSRYATQVKQAESSCQRKPAGSVRIVPNTASMGPPWRLYTVVASCHTQSECLIDLHPQRYVDYNNADKNKLKFKTNPKHCVALRCPSDTHIACIHIGVEFTSSSC